MNKGLISRKYYEDIMIQMYTGIDRYYWARLGTPTWILSILLQDKIDLGY